MNKAREDVKNLLLDRGLLTTNEIKKGLWGLGYSYSHRSVKKLLNKMQEEGFVVVKDVEYPYSNRVFMLWRWCFNE